MKTDTGAGRVRAWLREHAAFLALFVLAVALRLGGLGVVPPGLNQDEASIGVDAYSLFHFGYDRNGVSWPVHLIAWGSGQNALYAWLSAPIVGVLGLNEVSVRLLNALAGCLGVAVAYWLGRRAAGKSGGLAFAFVVALSPWHVMATRWGLESNLFPSVALFAVGLLVAALSCRRSSVAIAAGAMLASCLYAYGTALPWVASFLALYGLLIALKRLPLPKRPVITLVSFALASVPIVVFYATNYFGFGTRAMGPITAPQLPATPRYSEAMPLYGDAEYYAFLAKQFAKAFTFTFGGGSDDIIHNAVPGYGTMSILSLPLFLWGLFAIRSKQGDERNVYLLFAAWLVASLPVLVLSDININRINIVFPVVLFFVAMGIVQVRRRSVWAQCAVVCWLALSSGGFLWSYFTQYPKQAEGAFFVGLEEAIQAATSAPVDGKTIVIVNDGEIPYVFPLFYDPASIEGFPASARYVDQKDPFRWVRSYGRYQFVEVAELAPEAEVFVFHRTERRQFPKSRYDVQRFGHYGVAVRLKD